MKGAIKAFVNGLALIFVNGLVLIIVPIILAYATWIALVAMVDACGIVAVGWALVALFEGVAAVVWVGYIGAVEIEAK